MISNLPTRLIKSPECYILLFSLWPKTYFPKCASFSGRARPGGNRKKRLGKKLHSREPNIKEAEKLKKKKIFPEEMEPVQKFPLVPLQASKPAVWEFDIGAGKERNDINYQAPETKMKRGRTPTDPGPGSPPWTTNTNPQTAGKT